MKQTNTLLFAALACRRLFLLAFIVILINSYSVNASTRTWIGAGAGGSGKDFNVGSNWAGGVAPSAGDDVVMMIFNLGSTTTVNVTASISNLKSLTITYTSLIAANFNLTINAGVSLSVTGNTILLNDGSAAFAAQLQFIISSNATFSCSDFTTITKNGLILSNYIVNQGILTINGNTLASAQSTFGGIYFGVDDAATTTFKGNVFLDDGLSASGSNIYLAGKIVTSTANSTGKYIFQSNLTLGPRSNSITGSLGTDFIFDGTTGTTQTITNNSSNTIRFSNFQAGSANSPIVILSGTNDIQLYPSAPSANLVVNNNSILDLGERHLNRSNSGGTFNLNNTATLKLAGTSGGQTGSNFPKGFTAALNSESTVEYYGTSAQTVYAVPDYGNLTLTNASTKTAGAALTILGNVLINSTATFSASMTGNGIDVGGNWTNYGNYIANSNKVNFNGASGTQLLTGNTTFFNLSLNNDVNFGTTITTVAQNLTASGGSMAPGTSTIIFTGNPGAMAGNNAKNFYDVQINNGAVIYHTVGGGGVHIYHSYANSGTFAQTSTQSTFFDQSGATENMYGNGTTTFGKIIIGVTSGIGSPTALNANNHNFTVTGGSWKFYHSSVFNGNTDTVTFSNINTTISGPGTSNFDNVITNVSLDFGNGISTVNNTLTINDGDITSNAPTYGNSSTLIYNTTIPNYTTNAEWNANNPVAGLGVPQNITITNTNSVAIAGDRTIPGTLTLTSGSLDINNNTLAVTNGFIGTGGDLKGSVSSNLTAGGTGTIFFNSAANYLKNFIINNGANLSLGNALNITASDNASANTFGIVTIGTGATLDATTNGFLTIKSDQNGDAVIGNSSGTINGDVTIERYIPWRRAWRFLSVPLSSSASNTQTIRGAWMEGSTPNPITSPANDPKPGFGTEITYLHGDNINGYDENITANPSIKVWDAGSNSWIPITSTNIPINTYPAYCLFVRGSRDVDLSQGQYALQHDATILRMAGLINQGAVVSQSFSVSTAGEFALIKNPYASPVKLTGGAVNYSGATPNYFYVWDPQIGGTYGVGKYVTCNGTTWSILGGSYSAETPVGVVQSGQAFLVQSNSTSGYINFTENAKTISEFNADGKMAKPQAILYVQLVLPTDNLKITDGVCAVFGNRYSKGRDEFDAPKIWNFEGDNMGLIRDTNALSIECRPVPVITDTLFLRLYLYPEPYALRIFSQNIPGHLPAKAWLVDKFLNIETEINLYDTTLYNFTPTKNADSSLDTSSYRNRFMLVFNRQMQGNPVAVTKAVNQLDSAATGFANSVATAEGTISIYPNPVSNNKAMLQFGNMDKGDYEVTIFNTKGQALANYTMQNEGDHTVYPLPLKPLWPAGIYNVKLINKNSKKETNIKLVISK